MGNCQAKTRRSIVQKRLWYCQINKSKLHENEYVISSGKKTLHRADTEDSSLKVLENLAVLDARFSDFKGKFIIFSNH